MAARPGYTERLNDLNRLIHTLSGMNDLLSQESDEKVRDLLKTGFIKQFEMSVELSWKVLKSILSAQFGVELASPKPIVKEANRQGILCKEDFEILFQAIDLRNQAAHLYQDELVDEILDFIPGYCTRMKSWINQLK